MPEPCPWCSGQEIDPGPIQCDCTGLCGYDWCPAAARYIEAGQREELGQRIAALRESRIAALRESRGGELGAYL